MFIVSPEELKRVLEDFYAITKFKIVLYNADRQILATYPDHMCSFCHTVRTCDALAKKCISCDNVGFDFCDKSRMPYIYKCHMSVTEAVAPICSGNIIIGYLLFGQILDSDREKVYRAARAASEKYGLIFTEKMFSEMTTADEPYIQAAVNMMSMCASYLYANEIIRHDQNIIVYQLKEYLNRHLSEPLSVETLCSQFYLSRSKLYLLSKAYFGVGISDYIRTVRLERAKTLLRDTEESVSQIAAKVGIPDPNYFIRIFRQFENITPLQYRLTIRDR